MEMFTVIMNVRGQLHKERYTTEYWICVLEQISSRIVSNFNSVLLVTWCKCFTMCCVHCSFAITELIMKDRDLLTMNTVSNCLQHFLRNMKSWKKAHLLLKLVKLGASAFPMDQGLKRAYNKPVQGNRSIIGFTKCKEALAQFNLLRHERARIS